MSRSRHSRTAEGVAALRAAEAVLRSPERRVYDDPLARHLVSPRLRLLLAAPPLLRVLAAAHDRWYRGMVHEVPVRARYAWQCLQRAAAGGVSQVVILGAGLDATAWRPDLPSGLTVFEVERAATIRIKRERLARAGLAVPPRVVFVPIDLGRDDLEAALEERGHVATRPSFVTILGVLPYLTGESARAVLAQTASRLAPGSEVVYSFPGRAARDPRAASPGMRRALRRLARLGEPVVFGADPEEMAALIASAGLRQVECFDGAAMTARYLAGQGPARVVDAGLHLARAVPASPAATGG